ncbi:MAG: hypothetical protein PHI48_09650 [Bacteroidales bacterium]|nr:hypothetical protein [Bacteroidales bacterium]
MKTNHLFSVLLMAILCTGFIACSDDNDNEPKVVVDVRDQMDDITFKQYCLENYDSNKDGKVSALEADSVTQMDIEHKFIHSLKGIEVFYNLSNLNVTYNDLTTLDISKCKSLTYLRCALNKITSLKVNGCTTLTNLDCNGNKITTLDVSQCVNLIIFECATNNLETLNYSGCANLKHLDCSYNNISSIDLSHYPKLEGVSCRDNHLTTIDASKCPELTLLDCTNNNLTGTLDLSKCGKLNILWSYRNPNLSEVWLKAGKVPSALEVDDQVTVTYK